MDNTEFRCEDMMSHEGAARRYLQAVCERAYSDADMVIRLLEEAGAIASSAKRRKQMRSIPLGLALKLAAWLRLRLWDEANIRPLLIQPLPATSDVKSDLRRAAPGEKYAAKELSTHLLGAFLREMAWDRADSSIDVVVNAIDGDEVIEHLAAFLWQHRKVAVENREI
jgi:hypothetical protein